MIKILLIILITTTFNYSQNNYSLVGCIYDQVLEFLDNGNLISFSIEEYCNKERDSCFSKFVMRILSKVDGSIVKEILVYEGDREIFDVAVSHNGESIAVLAANKYYKNGEIGTIKIEKYSLIKNCLEWENEFDAEIPGLRLCFNEDDTQIVCITSQNILFINAMLGSVTKINNNISSIIDYNYPFSKFNISKNGKYFIYWQNKYFTFSKHDDSGIQSIVDLVWYGARWTFYLGSIPQYIYIWDIDEDKLYEKIQIPFETEQGTPAFTEDEETILIGPINGIYREYDLDDKKTIREFSQADSIKNDNESILKDFRIISSDKKFFANCINDNDILVFNNTNGDLIKNLKRTTSASGSLNKYAMAFSLDSNYFAVVTKGNKICLYDTQTWEIIWEREYCK